VRTNEVTLTAIAPIPWDFRSRARSSPWLQCEGIDFVDDRRDVAVVLGGGHDGEAAVSGVEDDDRDRYFRAFQP
jgi:hypothetical protein